MCQGPTKLRLIGCLTGLTLDPKMRIKYIDIKNQLLDMLTFTRDEWNHLLLLLNFMNSSMSSCGHFFLSNRAKAQLHGNERTRRYFRRRFGDGETEIFERGDRETKTCKFACLLTCWVRGKIIRKMWAIPTNPVNAKAEQGSASTGVWMETDAKHKPKISRVFWCEELRRRSRCRYLETGTEKSLFGLNKRLETNAECGHKHE